MPAYVARRIQDRLIGDGKALRDSKIPLLGFTYEASIAAERESPAVTLALKLLAMGADLRFQDPYVSVWNAAEPDGPEQLLKGKSDLRQAIVEQIWSSCCKPTASTSPGPWTGPPPSIPVEYSPGTVSTGFDLEFSVTRCCARGPRRRPRRRRG